ncbi:MAG: type I methionyl aminopeptidase [Clostridiales bacterium]|nr:type I methionyl aminopeptidase [Candidatus Apopatousia equi]
MIILKSKKQIDLMREAGKITIGAIMEVGKHIRPGITTLELDTIAEDYIRSHGAIPSFKGYDGYPASICASVNEVVVHGIPSPFVVLKEGDIISIDCGAYIHGYHGDATRTFAVGKISEAKQKLIDITKQSFFEGVSAIKVGGHIGDIGEAIQTYVEKNGFSVVREMVGHGIGKDMHEDPQVPNYGHKNFGEVIEDGLVIAIEPMINMGKKDIVIKGDGWTCITRDGKPSCHYENTVAIIDGKVEILTLGEE